MMVCQNVTAEQILIINQSFQGSYFSHRSVFHCERISFLSHTGGSKVDHWIQKGNAS